MTVIRIGSRGSKLALWQSHFVAEKLQKKGMQTDIEVIETKGDKILNAPFAEIGTKGLFTEELETKLREGSIDIAVHSAKDLQSDLGDDLEIIAYSSREEPSDVLVSFSDKVSLEDEGLIVGTSSTRRTALLKQYYPHIQITGARGNLQTRFRKMEEGKYDAMILAYAGVHRMNYNKYIADILPLNIFTPAAGQGCIAIEASSGLDNVKKELIRATLNDIITEYCVKAERAFLKELEGGCSIPSFMHAKESKGNLFLTGGIVSLDGKKIIRMERTCSNDDGEKAGTELAQMILKKGGAEILQEVKESLNKSK